MENAILENGAETGARPAAKERSLPIDAPFPPVARVEFIDPALSRKSLSRRGIDPSLPRLATLKSIAGSLAGKMKAVALGFDEATM